MRFTYHDIKENIINNYNKDKICSLSKEDQKGAVKTFFRFLCSKKPKLEDINFQNISDFLTNLPYKSAFFFFEIAAKVDIYGADYKYLTNMHIKLREKIGYEQLYLKIVRNEIRKQKRKEKKL